VIAALHAAVLFACWRCPTPPRIHRYIGAKLWWHVARWAVRAAFGFHSREYRWAFVASFLWIFVVSLDLVWEYVSPIHYKVRRLIWPLAFAFALFLSGRILISHERYDKAVLLDGALAILLAIPMCIAAVTREGRAGAVAAVLGFTWLIEAGSQLGFSIHLPAGLWSEPNIWLPVAIACIGSIALARAASTKAWSRTDF